MRLLRLIQKTQLTHDVYRLIYSTSEPIDVKPGQFFLCDCDADDTTKKRSYSLAWSDGMCHEFIIKRIEDGTGGSRAICDQEIGREMEIAGPLGHFVLPEDHTGAFVFVGTGTGFAPLYFQIRALLEKGNKKPIRFLFGVRSEQDIFYEDILQSWTEIYPNFSYQLCLSRPKNAGSYFTGYVTQCLENMKNTTSEVIYSLCGSPAMVRDARETLEQKKVSKDNIFFEQY